MCVWDAACNAFITQINEVMVMLMLATLKDKQTKDSSPLMPGLILYFYLKFILIFKKNLY